MLNVAIFLEEYESTSRNKLLNPYEYREKYASKLQKYALTHTASSISDFMKEERNFQERDLKILSQENASTSSSKIYSTSRF